MQRIDVLLTYLRVGKFTNYRRAPVGEVPCQKIGRHWRFRKEAIDRWLEDLPAEA
ncbi:MAG: excisionase family DNA-binding protein [Deltaproteobacteria bacterium]|nr:excisionase family DNA-binding protein [Deltaproteobacteria bacterium]